MKSFSSSLHILRLKSMSMFTSPVWEEGGGEVSQQEPQVVVVATGAELTPAAVLLTEGVHAWSWKPDCCAGTESWGVSPLSPISQSKLFKLPSSAQSPELFYFNLILYAKQEWLVRSLSLLGVLISEYFQLHKWISSVLTSKKTLWKPLNFVLKWEGQGLIKSLGVNDIVITRCLYIDDYLIKFILPRRCPFHISALTMAVAPRLPEKLLVTSRMLTVR